VGLLLLYYIIMQLNGRELKITPASFAEAMALQKAIGRAVKGTRFSMPSFVTGADGKIDLEKSDVDLSGLIDLVLGAAVSDEVQAALFACSARAMLGNEIIDADFFEDNPPHGRMENRELYYPIMVEIIRVNVGPFLKGLASKFGALAGTSLSFQKSS
jgi:hypothetical protein